MNGRGNGTFLFVTAPQVEHKLSQSGYFSIQGGLDSWPSGSYRPSGACLVYKQLWGRIGG
jgi:hypothetical protein